VVGVVKETRPDDIVAAETCSQPPDRIPDKKYTILLLTVKTYFVLFALDKLFLDSREDIAFSDRAKYPSS
jgi:hypothetical protein